MGQAGSYTITATLMGTAVDHGDGDSDRCDTHGLTIGTLSAGFKAEGQNCDLDHRWLDRHRAVVCKLFIILVTLMAQRHHLQQHRLRDGWWWTGLRLSRSTARAGAERGRDPKKSSSPNRPARTTFIVVGQAD